MSIVARHCHRLAASLVRHASHTMPYTRAPWAEAMRNEFEHIRDQPGALAWAAGCILASYKSRLTELRPRHAIKTLRAIAACGFAALLIGYAIESPASGQTPPPAFTDAACDLPHITPEIRPRLRCGTVSVPRDYAHPAGGSFRLAVVVIRSRQQPASPDPLVYISGGPGSPLLVYSYAQAMHPFAADRDLILVDQRGIGRSEPSICPDHDKAMFAALAMVAVAPTADAQARRRAVLMACRDEAISRGIDLKDFGTSVTVQDFDTVRRALGVQRWNVFGVSYGTTVAMTLMARYPETLRSVVLDSVNPPDPVLPPWSLNVADARDAFFAACDKDAACAAAYPHLADTYRDTMQRLEQSPLSMNLPSEMRDLVSQGRLTAPLFELVVGHLIYDRRLYPDLPRLIASVYDGDTTFFAPTLTALYAQLSNPDTGSNSAANAAVECRDRPRYRQSLAANADIFDQTSLYGICAGWSDLGPTPLIPRDTLVPALVLAGQFDPNARPPLSRHVADLIGARAQWVEFALAGHSVRDSSPCASRIVAAFVNHPTQVLDTSCADRPPPIRFLPMHPTP